MKDTIVRFWHLADIRMSAFSVAIGGRTDIVPKAENVANDPKRTSAPFGMVG